MKKKDRIETILAAMTLEEKAKLCYGCTGMSVGHNERLGIPEMFFADGPQGIRFEDGRKSTMLPSGMALAATFDVDMAKRFGAVIGREGNANNVKCSLGPAFNLMRSPLCGRNFEYYGEDPVLAGRIASGYVEGCQGEGVAATPKHLALNNQERLRCSSSSNCDERTMRELYLRAFEIVTKEAHPWAMMSSYNRINGVYASACKQTQQDIVKDEWGFDGVMMSDWGGVHETVGCANGGLDLEMGSWPPFFEKLADAVREGKVKESVLDDHVRRILRLLERTNCFEPEKGPKGEANTKRNRDDAKRIAEAGTVLLRNQKNILPLKGKYKKIAVVGPNAELLHSSGGLEFCGGSGAVYPTHETSPLEGLQKAFGGDSEIIRVPGVKLDRDCQIAEAWLHAPNGKSGLKYEFFDNLEAMHSGTAKPFAVREAAPMSFCAFGHLASAGQTKRDALAEELSPRPFALRLTGTIVPAESGTVLFGVKSANFGVVVRLNGRVRLKKDSRDRGLLSECKLRVVAGKPLDVVVEIERLNDDYSDMQLLWKCGEKALIAEAIEAVKAADLAIFVGGRTHADDTEGISWGPNAKVDIATYELGDRQDELLKAICATKTPVIGVFNCGSPFSVEPWIEKIAAMLVVFYPGMENGTALAELLTGKAAPGGRLPFTWAKKLTDYPCHANGTFPGVVDGPTPHTDYTEGVFIGYRAFEKNEIEPRFPFGFGLTYGKFDCRLADCRVVRSNLAKQDVEVEASVEVKNVGKVRDTEVIQLYVGDVKCSVERPVKELEAFAKVELAPGETKTVVLRLNWRDFAFWSVAKNAFTVEPGKFVLSFGTSGADLFATQEITL